MSESTKDSVNIGRRNAIAKLGAYAAFTVPAVTALLVSQKASALSIVIVKNMPAKDQPKADETRVA
jgi:hypothetical protein